MENLNDDYYEFIGAKRVSSEKEIKEACNRLLMKYHPDKCKDVWADGITKRIYEIKEVLLNSEKRKTYDRILNEKKNSQQNKSKNEGEPTKIIGLAGRSCSGKSTIARMIESNYSHRVIRICQDRFFKKQADDWESPNALNNYNLIYSLKKIKNGQSTHIPSAGWTEVYDRLIEPRPIVLVEGFLLFENQEIVDLCDVKMYIDINDVNILYRRTKRDGTSNCIDYTMFDVIEKSYKYMTKQKQVADVIIDGNKSKENMYNDAVRYLKGNGLL
jgi:uridine kinase